MPRKLPEGWKRVERTFFWRPDVGTAVLRHNGWFASNSAYPDKLIEPVVGPFPTVYEAIDAYEKVRESA